ncbi:hypothetical protein V6N13_087984 [Hibiscus sabdariffa]|uniref:RNase H type-1 domain-containing protein n=1 Tax=Hibiscus sabdariffa TaxID=183260 RepID=A0ABR2FXY0_9ROSI
MIFAIARIDNSEFFGCGGVLCGQFGAIRAIFPSPISPYSIGCEEAWTISIALDIYLEFVLFNGYGLIIESVSLTTLSWIQNSSSRPWRMGKFLKLDLKIS